LFKIRKIEKIRS